MHILSTVRSFECLNLATSFSVRKYIFRISRSHWAAYITVLNCVYVVTYCSAWQILCVSFAAFVCNCNKETLLLLLLLLLLKFQGQGVNIKVITAKKQPRAGMCFRRTQFNSYCMQCMHLNNCDTQWCRPAVLYTRPMLL